MHNDPQDTNPTTHHDPTDDVAAHGAKAGEPADDLAAHALGSKNVPPAANDVQAHLVMAKPPIVDDVQAHAVHGDVPAKTADDVEAHGATTPISPSDDVAAHMTPKPHAETPDAARSADDVEPHTSRWGKPAEDAK
jgi:hypothetical protein